MPKLNLDEFSEKLFEPITITIGGKEYTVTKVTEEILGKLTEAVGIDYNKLADVALEQNDYKAALDYYKLAKTEKTNSLRGQLSDILGVHKDTFNKTDIRQIAAAIRFISGNIMKGIEADPKNFILAGESTSQQSSTPSPAPSPSTT
jgi:hypothetical protein